MSNAPTEFMKAHGIDASEVWQVRPGTFAVKHAALERAATNAGIQFGAPAVLQINLADKLAAVMVTGTMKDRSDWSTGEAAPYNNKNGYPVAMAEKRARDRVTLKLLNAGGSLYSEDEADDFKQPTNGHANGSGANITQTQVEELIKLADDVGADKAKFCKYLKVESLAALPAARYQQAKDALEAKRAA